MIMLKLIKFKNVYRDFKANPREATGKEVVDLIKEMTLIPKISGLLVLIILFIFGFTSLITEPVLICKIIFFILLPIYVTILIILRAVLKLVQRTVERVVSRVG